MPGGRSALRLHRSQRTARHLHLHLLRLQPPGGQVLPRLLQGRLPSPHLHNFRHGLLLLQKHQHVNHQWEDRDFFHQRTSCCQNVKRDSFHRHCRCGQSLNWKLYSLTLPLCCQNVEGLLSQKLQMWTKLELKTLLIDIASIFSKLEPETVSFHRQCTCQNNVVVVNSSSEIFFIDIAAVAKTCSEKPSIDVKCKLSKH